MNDYMSRKSSKGVENVNFVGFTVTNRFRWSRTGKN